MKYKKHHTLIAATCFLATSFMATNAMGLELTAAHVNPSGEPSNVAFAELARRLENSETGLSMTVFPQGQVGGEKDAIEQVQFGALTMTTVATSSLSSFVPAVGVFDIPFLFRDSDTHPWHVVDGPIGEEIAQAVEASSDLEVLGYWSAGMRHIFTRDVDVETPADLLDLKTRVIGSPVYIDTFNALGSKATPMPYGELYTALATGAIDAAENDISGYRNMRFYEQAPHLSLTGHFFLYKLVIANRSAMEELSPEQRAEFDDIFAEVTEMQRRLFQENREQDLAFLREQGVTITEPDVDAFIDATSGVAERYAQEFGVDLVERIRNTQ